VSIATDHPRFTVLDPRITYNGLQQAYSGNLDMITDLVKSKAEFRKHFLVTYVSGSTSQSSPSSPAPRPTSQFGSRFFARFTHGAAERVSGPDAELEALFQLRAESFDACPDPVKWWAGRRAQFPLLSRFARDIFSIPGMCPLRTAKVMRWLTTCGRLCRIG
jgi:hypothetical protein